MSVEMHTTESRCVRQSSDFSLRDIPARLLEVHSKGHAGEMKMVAHVNGRYAPRFEQDLWFRKSEACCGAYDSAEYISLESPLSQRKDEEVGGRGSHRNDCTWRA